MKLRKILLDEKGELVIEKLIAAGAIILILGALIAIFGSLSKTSVRVSGDRAEAGQLEQLAYTLRRESTDAAALFVPANDVNGVSNADGHAVGAYFRDGQSHQPSFVEYVCTGDCAMGATHTGGSVQRYTFTTWTNPASTLKAEGPPITGVGMEASYLLVSEIATKGPYAQVFADRFAAAGISAPPDRLINVGYPGIQTGNRITVVKLENRVNAYELHLLPLAIPTVNNGVVIGYFTPTPNPLCVFTSSCGATVASFGGNNAPPQTMGASQVNYPATSSYNENDTCAGIATIAAINATGPNPSWQITPIAGNRLGGSCSVTITDFTKQTGSIIVTVAANSVSNDGTCPGKPAGTFLYTDYGTIPPTDHYASGASTCATPTPSPAPTPPTATPTPFGGAVTPTPTPTPFGGAVTPTPSPTPVAACSQSNVTIGCTVNQGVTADFYYTPKDVGCKPGDGGCVAFPYWTGNESASFGLTLTAAPSASYPLTISLGHPHATNLASASYQAFVSVTPPFSGAAAATLVSRGFDADVFTFTAGTVRGSYSISVLWQDNNTGTGIGQPTGCDQINGCSASYTVQTTLN